jgi:PadR family transcriptional regulator PadR
MLQLVAGQLNRHSQDSANSPEFSQAHQMTPGSSTIVDNLQYMAKPTDLVQGTLDLLILKTISLEPKHGWAIAKRIQQVSGEILQIQQGSLYPALHRLEQQAWIHSAWRPTEAGRMAKFYSLTASGRRPFEAELANWNRLSAAIDLVVQEA